jgi:putative redox protein
VVEILKKQRQPLDDLHISVNGKRPDSGSPTPFTSISIHFTLYGDLDSNKAGRAVKLAVDDYCSARASLADSVDVSHSFEIKQTAAN